MKDTTKDVESSHDGENYLLCPLRVQSPAYIKNSYNSTAKRQPHWNPGNTRRRDTDDQHAHEKMSTSLIIKETPGAWLTHTCIYTHPQGAGTSMQKQEPVYVMGEM